MRHVLPKQSEAGALAVKTTRSYTVTLWQRACSVDYRGCIDTAAGLGKSLVGIARTAAWLLPLIVFVSLLVESLNSRTLIIEGITVPEHLQKNGFTPEVASQRLYDALEDFVDNKKKTSMRSPDIRLHGSEPNFTVPGVGLSLDAVAATVRRFFHRDDHRVITGDLTVSGGKVWLRLRLNKAVFYDSKEGTSLDDVDKLFKAAAQDIIWRTSPYLLASATYATDPDKALEMVSQITAQERPGDENISRAYNLKAMIYRDRQQYRDAMTAVKKALEFDPHLAVAHNTMGSIFFEDKNYSQARDEFKAAIENDRNYTLAYINLGLDLHNLHDEKAAEAAYRSALKLEPNNAKAIRYLTELLRALGRADEIARLPVTTAMPISKPAEAGAIKTDAVNGGPTVESGVLSDLRAAPSPDLNAPPGALETHTVGPRPEASD